MATAWVVNIRQGHNVRQLINLAAKMIEEFVDEG